MTQQPEDRGTQPAPRPWHRDGFNLTTIIIKENGNYRNLLDCRYDSKTSLEEAISNSSFIVKCVNNHEKLVEALRSIIITPLLTSDNEKLDGSHEVSFTISMECLNKVKKALKEIEE